MNRQIINKGLSSISIKPSFIKRLPLGAVRNTYLIRSNKKEFILKIFDKSKKSQTKNLITLLRKINSKKEITINPIHSNVLSFGDSVGFVYSFFEGKEFGKVNVLNKLSKFGKIVGEFNKASINSLSAKLKIDEKNKINSSVERRILEIKKTIKFLKENTKPYSNRIIKLFSEGTSIAKGEKNVSGFRISQIHGDLHFENVLYNSRTKEYRIIDVFNIGPDFLLKEIMVSISHLVTDSSKKNKWLIKKILDGYEPEVRLTKKEKRAIPLFMLLHKMGEVSWLINQYKDKNIPKKVFDKYMAIDPKKLKIIIGQYKNLVGLQ